MDLSTLAQYRPQLDAIALDARGKLDALRAMPPITVELRPLFAQALQDAKAKYAQLDAEEKKIARPTLLALEAARSLFRAPKGYYKDLEEELKRRLKECAETEAARAVEATERAQALAASGDAEGAMALLAEVSAPTEKIEGLQERHGWGLEVTNIELLPTEFLVPNLKALGAAMRMQLKERPDETPVIPGVRFSQTTIIASTARVAGNDGEGR